MFGACAQSVFHDPQGRFSFRPPRGWTVTPLNANCVQLSQGSAYITLLAFEGSDPDLFLNSIAGQTARQWRVFTKVRSGTTEFAGRQAIYATYSGVNPKKVEAQFEMIAASSAPWTYVLMMSAPSAEFSRLTTAADGIGRSFVPAPSAVASHRDEPVQPARPGTGSRQATAGNAWRVRRASVVDEHGFERPVRALSLFLPVDWRLQSGIEYARAAGCPANLVHLAFRASSPDGSLGLEMLPGSVWQWAADPEAVQMMRMNNAQMSRYGLQGCPVMPAMTAAEYLRRVAIPQARPGARLDAVEPMPELAAQVQLKAHQQEQLAGTMGMRVRFQADVARARIDYIRDGRAAEEWITAVVFTAAMPGPSLNPRTKGMGQTMYYSCEASYLFAARAPAGELQGHERFFLMLISSVQLDAEWQARITQAAAQMNAENGAAAAQRSAIIADAGRQIGEMTARGYAQRSRMEDSSAKQFDQYIRGVQTYRNPATGETVELSNEYGRAWANGRNEYILSDSATFNPNVALHSGSWTELEPVKP